MVIIDDEIDEGNAPGGADKKVMAVVEHNEGNALFTEETKAKRHGELREWITNEHRRFRESSNLCFKMMVLVRFDLTLLALANYYGPFFV